MTRQQDSVATVLRRSARLALVALSLSAGFSLQEAVNAETMYYYVVGRHYQNQILFCRSPAARNNLIVLWQQGIGGVRGPQPQGCALERIAFEVLGLARNTVTAMPGEELREDGTRRRLPARFLVAHVAATRPGLPRERIYVVLLSDLVSIRTIDGRPVPELDDP
jgi:hypothetical protein